jgi:hypothetical protein
VCPEKKEPGLGKIAVGESSVARSERIWMAGLPFIDWASRLAGGACWKSSWQGSVSIALATRQGHPPRCIGWEAA